MRNEMKFTDPVKSLETMAIEQNFFETEVYFEQDDDSSLKQKINPISTSTKTSDSSDNGSFDCNICLESACDPVVSLCGHLYCWPCIYKWLYVESSSTEPNKEQRHCPVCKSNLSDSSFVPLYGHGKSHSESKPNNSGNRAAVPRRPPPSGLNASPTGPAPIPNPQLPPDFVQSQPHTIHHQHLHGGEYAALHSLNLMGTTMASLVNPTIGVFGEMFLTRVFRTSDPSLLPYPYRSVPPIFAAAGTPGMRRQEMQLDKSLSRVLIFLICFVILCLFTF